MPNAEDLKKAAERREKRKLAREAAVEQAHAEAQNLSDVVAASQKAAETKKPAPAKKSAKEQRAAERKANEAKADAEEKSLRVETTSVDLKSMEGRAPTLHELNRMAKEANAHIRDEAIDIAKAAGAAALNAALGKRTRHASVTRFAKMRDAQDAKAKQEAAKAEAQ